MEKSVDVSLQGIKFLVANVTSLIFSRAFDCGIFMNCYRESYED